MDMTSIAAAYNGLKTAKDVFSGLAGLKVETETLSKINDAVKKFGEAQDALFQLREELFQLQEEKNTLKKQLAESKSWENKISQYTLAKTQGGAVVYKSKDEPIHYACPSCVNKHELQFLQEEGGYSGDSICPGCGIRFPVEPQKDMPPIDCYSSEFV